MAITLTRLIIAIKTFHDKKERKRVIQWNFTLVTTRRGHLSQRIIDVSPPFIYGICNRKQVEAYIRYRKFLGLSKVTSSCNQCTTYQISRFRISQLKCILKSDDRELLSFSLTADNLFNTFTSVISRGRTQPFFVIFILNQPKYSDQMIRSQNS